MLEIFELCVLALAPWPLYRALAIPSFRRFYACFAVFVAGLLAGYAAAIAILSVYLPVVLHGAALLALFGLLWERWRARNTYGKATDLPPGSLALVPRVPWIDHRFYLKQAGQHGPIFKMSLFLRPMVCVVGAGLGREFLQLHGAVLRAPPVRFNRFVPGGFLRYMEGDVHARYRKLFQLGFARSVLQASAKPIEAAVRRALCDIAGTSQSAGNRGISPRDGFRDMLIEILLRLFFGVPAQSDDFQRLSALYDKIDVRKAACGSANKERKVAREIAALIKQQADLIRAPGADGAPVSLLGEILRRQPDAARDQTVLLNLVYMVQVARDDMTGLLLWMLKKLSDDRQIVEQLRPEIGDAGDRPDDAVSELAGAIVKETLRLEQSEFLSRKTDQDIHFKGFSIPKGWRIRICIREGHRNPDIFTDPDRFDPHRFIDHSYSSTEYSPLGMLNRSCLGAQIVDSIGRTFVTVLAQEFDWLVSSDGPRVFGAAHWTTNAAFKINLQARQRQTNTARA